MQHRIAMLFLCNAFRLRQKWRSHENAVNSDVTFTTVNALKVTPSAQLVPLGPVGNYSWNFSDNRHRLVRRSQSQYRYRRNLAGSLSLSIGIELQVSVSVSVSKKLDSRSQSQYRYRKNWTVSLSLSISIEKIWHQVSVSVSIQKFWYRLGLVFIIQLNDIPKISFPANLGKVNF